MADRNLVKDLKRWAKEEFSLPPESLPTDNYFKTLCVGSGKSIWRYISQHVFQQRNGKIMRGNLQWYKVLQDRELKQVEDQSEAMKKKELQKKIEQLRADICQLDSQIGSTEEQLATQEQSIHQIWTEIESSQHRQLLLDAFRETCRLGRKELSDEVQKISDLCHLLDNIARKAEIQVLFGDELSSSKDDGLNLKTAAEAQVLRELRELCSDRIHFFKSLQESELKKHNTTAKHMSSEQRTAVFQYWLSTAQNVLGGYPPNHILSALQYLATREQKELEEKIGSLNVTQDVMALQFRYEGNQLLDISTDLEEALPPVETLFEAAWEEIQLSFVELAQTRSRLQKLKNQLQTQKEQTEQEVSGFTDESTQDSLALSSFDVELRFVMQTAARDYIRELCVQLDQHAKSRQDALKNIRSQWQSILNFKDLVALRQEQIRGLIKGNSTAKTQLICAHRKLKEFIERKLVPEFEGVVTAASNLRNSISKEARQFGTVSLLSLDRRTVDGTHRVPASRLSICRLQSPSFSSLCRSLAFPLYKAPEELCHFSRSVQVELRFLRRLLQLHSATKQKVQKETEQLLASDQKALLSRVREEDEKLLKVVLPRARSLSHRCAQGLSYGDQVKTTISYWWDKPAQHVLPQLRKEGLSYQQWLQRWKRAAERS